MPDNPTEGLKPEILWQRFYEISRVPRPSKKEGKILEYIRNLLNELKISFKEDKVGNIIASVPATKGLENAPVVILQGHVDMVCEKNKDKKHDFDTDPILLKKEGDWITADGTTLGSDNGIGVAAALAVITDKDVVHGPLEILLTIDEETGLTGATNLENNSLKGNILLNMDSEEEGTFYVGCSGGLDTMASYKIENEAVPGGLSSYDVQVTGLKGGHSGLDINTNRGNAIKLLARILKTLDKFNYLIARIEGGSKRNAIPREAEAQILIQTKDEKDIKSIINNFQVQLQNEFKTSDGGLKLIFEKSDREAERVYTKTFSEKIINTLLALPHGVITMSQDIPDLVETSTNLATIFVEDSVLTIGTSQRSSVESAKQYIGKSVQALFELSGAQINTGDGYPGWKPNLDSGILKMSKAVYKEIFSKEPEIKAIHAGLECGILGDKKPGLDMVSFGPTIEGAHSPDERVNIKTVEKFYMLLKGILKKVTELN